MRTVIIAGRLSQAREIPEDQDRTTKSALRNRIGHLLDVIDSMVGFMEDEGLEHCPLYADIKDVF